MKATISVGVSLPSDIISKIDRKRGDVSRSRFLLRLIENVEELKMESKKVLKQTGIEAPSAIVETKTPLSDFRS